MNRRDFFKTSALGIAVAAITPTLSLAADEVPMYKQFDYFDSPTATLWRVNNYRGNLSVVTTTAIAKTWKLKLKSDIIVDHTEETIRESRMMEYGHGIKPFKYTRSYNTNELLLNEAKALDITHIYCFFRGPALCDPVTGKLFVSYFVRGARMPEWKLINNKLQVVKVNEKGETEREARKRVS